MSGACWSGKEALEPMATKTVRNPTTGVVVTVSEAEAAKLCKTGWVYTSKYELKRQAAIAKAKQQQTQAA